VLTGVAVSVFLIASQAMQKQQARIPAGEELSQGLQKAGRRMREAIETIDEYKHINQTIQYQDVEDGRDYLLYLYSPDDAVLNNAYERRALYQLRLAPVTGFVYGTGEILVRSVLSPSAPDGEDRAVVRYTGKAGDRMFELILTVAETLQPVAEKTEKVKMRLYVRPRNQGTLPL
ncbi:MAG: hypothetical protein ABH845_01745, partial [Candidatus Omnitrophota bacterium]